MAELEILKAKRLAKWRQDGSSKIPDPDAAAAFIDEVGICTHYAASSEFPNLFQGYMGDGNAKTTASWDSPSGHVYTWRWALGRKHVAFYGAIVAGKPTWVSWEVLPYLLAACMEMRTPDELYDAGLISEPAYKVASAFDGTDGVLSTKELRERAGFPTGKDNRARYLKALGELESLLLIAKRFGEGPAGEDMNHALVDVHYREFSEKARAGGPEAGLVGLLERYLPGAVFLDPKVFSRHLRLSPEALDAAIGAMVAAGKAERAGALVVAC
jgi:hypothetical protein